MNFFSSALVRSLGFFIASNTFMNLAWYAHLKIKGMPLWTAIMMSWGIAFFEYAIMIPGTRIANDSLNLTQIKVTQEVCSIAMFVVIASLMFGLKLTYNHLISFGFLILACYFAFRA